MSITIRRLSIHDFILVEHLDLDLREGLNVLSGGSGEGKTLVVRALEFLLGGQPYGRASAARWVRQGAAEARVEAWLEGPPDAVAEALRAAGLQVAPDHPGEALVVRRTLDRAGRGRCAVGPASAPAAVTLPTLRELGRCLVEVFGQGEATELKDEGRQRALLDAAGGLDAAREYAALRARALEAARERDRVAAEEARLLDDRSRVAAEHDALAELAPEADEYEALVEEAARLAERELEVQQLGAVVSLLDDDDGAACDRLRQAIARLDRTEAFDLTAARQALDEALTLTADATERVRRAHQGVELDASRADEVRERLASFRALARRLRTAPEALAARWQELGPDIDPAVLAERRERLDAALAALRPELAARRDAISQARRDASPRLARAVGRMLPDLGLDGARFEVLVDSLTHATAPCSTTPSTAATTPDDGAEQALLREHPAPHGRDRVAFLVAPGPTQPLGGLDRVSGGELARLFLALALETAGASGGARRHAPLLVFDEVDQNVGARLGAAVGRCLAGIGRGRQVLAITHLATVAARADHHVRILKAGGRTRAVRLEGDERVEELALMIKGAPITDAARAQARELLHEASAPATPPAATSSRPAKRPRKTSRRRALATKEP